MLIPKEQIEIYRQKIFRLLPGQRLTTPEEAIKFVNQRGFIYFWPIRDIVMPSLWAAAAGDRPVADAHDDPGHITWGWKDSLLDQRKWYYAKVLRKRATIIALDVAPFFYALSENYGAPEEDYLTIYEQGRMTLEAKTVYEALLDNGPLDTVALRKAARMTSSESDARFNKALTDLQCNLMILPTAVTQAGAWRYAFAYDVVARYYPELPMQAQAISERQARQKLAGLYLKSVGAARVKDVAKLFGWRMPNVQGTLERLVQQGEAQVVEVEGEGEKGEFYAAVDLME
jgi:hypothetical protein